MLAPDVASGFNLTRQMTASTYKIGQMASRMGISVRTLRHYDAIGLLSPSCRTAAGHRIYTDREVSRLHKIVALRRMGFSLAHVRTIVSGDTRKAYVVLEGHAQRLREQMARQREILNRLDAVVSVSKTRDEPYNDQEIEAMKKQAAELREALTLEMERGTDPKDACVQDLVRRLENLWTSAFRAFRVRNRLQRFETLPHQRQVHGLTQTFREVRMFYYLHRARA
jgi:DNA-binding transcriptional MerR regulator